MNIRAILQLAVLPLVVLASPPADAQVSIAGSYYQSEVSFSCPSSYACYVRFPQLPLEYYTTFKRVHCSIRRGTGLRTVQLGTHAGPTDSIFLRRVTLRPSLISTTDANNYMVNDEVNFLIGPGRYVTIFVDTSVPDAGFVSCQLIGELSSGPPVFQ